MGASYFLIQERILLMMRTTPLDILVKIGMIVNAIVIALLLAYYFSY